MISRTQIIPQERFPLAQIYLTKNLNSTINTIKNKHVQNHHFLNQLPLNSNQTDRLQSLKSNYNKTPDNENLFNLSQNPNSKPADSSFKSIHLRNSAKFNVNNLCSKFDSEEQPSHKKITANSKASLLNSQFQNKIQQSSQRLESNIVRVQEKLKILKQSYQKRQQTPNNENSATVSSINKSNYQQNKLKIQQNYKQNKEPRRQQQYQPVSVIVQEQFQTKYDQQNSNQSCSNRAYAQQLKSINFIDEIKRKIQEIQTETKSNLQKKAQEITKSSKIPNDKDIKSHSPQIRPQKITLANFAPNLAQSEVIETTERERFTDRNLIQKLQSIQSLVFQNYKFDPNHEPTRYKHNFSDRIMQDPQVEEISIQASPVLNKSPFGQTNLEETQMVERNSLQGDLEIVEEEIQSEFVLLINRLGYQAEIDNKLANEVFKYDNVFTQRQSLKCIILDRLKQHYAQNCLSFDQKMFQVSQMQLDPLAVIQKVHKDFSPEEIMKVGLGLKKLYDKNTYYFENKLLHSFSHKTIEFLIEELEKCHSLSTGEEINVGNLTSYVNMRTGKSLRNRYFYRTLKRIVRHNTKIGSTFRREDLFQAFVRK